VNPFQDVSNRYLEGLADFQFQAAQERDDFGVQAGMDVVAVVILISGLAFIAMTSSAHRKQASTAVSIGLVQPNVDANRSGSGVKFTEQIEQLILASTYRNILNKINKLEC
jgi:hypothetical protein